MIEPLLLLALAATPGASETTVTPLFVFSSEEAVRAWRPVHDGVMGGVSRGKVHADAEAAHFEGEVSLENNGGFASFRIDTGSLDLSGQRGIVLRVRGDGQVYKLSVATDGRWDGVRWQVPFLAPEGEWTDVELFFEDLVPRWRGRLVTDAEPFDASRIVQLGLSISDKQAGPFSLAVASIGARRTERSPRRDRTAQLAALVERDASGRELADAMQWSERVLVLAAPDDLDAAASIQLGRFLVHAGALAERDLRPLEFMGTRGGRLAGRTLDPEQVAELRAAWDLPAGAWTVALVGKDGGVKARWTEPVDPGAVFERIDAMPMRRREAEGDLER